jgi:catechol 2,3-dioxygenase-like lactoylglutathione lyase family enzyme
MKRLNKCAPGLRVTGLFLVLIINIAGAQSRGDSVRAVTKTNQIMEQRISFITIGAKDLNKLKEFYIDKFKWAPLKDSGGIVFFKMNGFILSLFPADELAEDATVSPEGNGFKKFTLAINYKSEKEVDEAFKALQGRGVRVVKAPQKASWGGYSGYVADIEDNLWEIAFNPFLEMDGTGNVLTHQ